MFAHLLVPVSGLEMIHKSMKNISKLALADHAEVILVHVSEPTPDYMYADNTFGYGISDASHKKSCEEYSRLLFDKARAQLDESIPSQSLHIFHVNVDEGIVEASKKTKSDVIVMASHKRSRLGAWFIGSETQAVIQHSKLPVLVI